MTVGILTESENILLQKTLENIREHLRIRQFTVKPFFKDFDKVCTGTGHVTRAQFRQCLTYMKVDVTDAEFDVLCKRWTKDEMSPVAQISPGKKDYIQTCSESICYLMFLQELENGMAPEMRESAEASEPVVPSVKTVSAKGTPAPKSLTPEEFQQLMSYIKAKVIFLGLCGL
jgi:hypothetical protein